MAGTSQFGLKWSAMARQQSAECTTCGSYTWNETSCKRCTWIGGMLARDWMHFYVSYIDSPAQTPNPPNPSPILPLLSPFPKSDQQSRGHGVAFNRTITDQ